MNLKREPLLANKVKIDEIDAKILKCLILDARAPFSDIAKKCGISTPAIIKRFNRLKQEKIIIGTAIRMGLKNLGYNYRLSIDLNIGNIESIQILSLCKKLHNFITCTLVVGKYDVHAVVYLKSLEQIEDIRQVFKNQKGIKRIGLTATYESGIFPENLVIEPTELNENG